jgi:protein phosphatase
VQGGQAWFAHAGDSRGYLFRGGTVLHRTRDHSKVQTLLSMGLIRPEEADRHPQRNMVLNCLGSPFEPTIETSAPTNLVPGDLILLCTDGLWAGVDETGIANLLGGRPLGDGVPAIIDQLRWPARDGRPTTRPRWRCDGSPRAMPISCPREALADGAFTTTIFGPADDAALPRDFTEEDIERTLREIQDAIDKSNSRSDPTP